MSNPALKQSTYIPTVDRWRALSIGLVILHRSPVQSGHSPLPARLVWGSLVFSQLHHAVPIPAHSPVALDWYTGHFWWLSLEEHFYLLLPGVLVVFRGLRLWGLAGLAGAVAFLRSVLAHLRIATVNLISARTYVLKVGSS